MSKNIYQENRTNGISAAPGEPCAVKPIGYVSQTGLDRLREWFNDADSVGVVGEPRFALTIPLYTTPQPAAGWGTLLRKIEYATRKDSMTDHERIQSIRSLVCAEISKSEARREAPAPAEIFPQDVIDRHLDVILTASGCSLRYFRKPLQIERMRQAMADVLAARPDTAEARKGIVPLADHAAIGMMLIEKVPYPVYAAMITIAAHCAALQLDPSPDRVFDLGGCISQECMTLAQALSQPLGAEARLREALETCREFIKGEQVENVVVCIRSMQTLGEMIDKALSPPSGGDEAKESEGEGKVDSPTALADKGQPRIHAHGVATVGTIAANMDSIGVGPSEPSPPADRQKLLAEEWKRQIINAGGDENVAQQAVALAALNGLFDYCAGSPADRREIDRLAWTIRYEIAACEAVKRPPSLGFSIDDLRAILAALPGRDEEAIRADERERCANIAMAIDSGRGNEKEIAKAIWSLKTENGS